VHRVVLVLDRVLAEAVQDADEDGAVGGGDGGVGLEGHDAFVCVCVLGRGRRRGGRVWVERRKGV
jgi:hypothetical protein